ncbi:unnamed protein product [Urochloa humidicola]
MQSWHLLCSESKSTTPTRASMTVDRAYDNEVCAEFAVEAPGWELAGRVVEVVTEVVEVDGKLRVTPSAACALSCSHVLHVYRLPSTSMPVSTLL